MSDRMIPVPESALRALAEWRERWPELIAASANGVDALVACLPEPESTFTDQEALAFYRAMYGRSYSTTVDIKYGRFVLSRLADVKWTAPKALCPPPSPELVEVVEAARDMCIEEQGAGPGWSMAKKWAFARLRDAVARLDGQEGTTDV